MAAAFVHETAVIDEGAELGDDAKIWHFTHVCEGAQIGARSVLGQSVFVGRHVKIGRGVKVQNNVSVYSGVTVEDDVFLGPSCVFTNVLTPRAHVERKEEFRPTIVGRGATVGANATILCGHDIGEYALIGAGSVVTRSVPPHAVVVGNPAHRTGWACRCGEVLRAEGTCHRCGSRYRVDDHRCDWMEDSD